MSNYKFPASKSKIFLVCLISFILGVGVSSFVRVDAFFIFCLALLSGLGLIFFLPRRSSGGAQAGLIFLFILFFFLGLWRYQISLPNFDDRKQVYFYNQKIVQIFGAISNLDRRIGGQKLTIDVYKINFEGHETPVQGKVLVSTLLYPIFEYGENLRIACQLKRPEKIEDFDYEKYLARYDIYATCYSDKIFLEQKEKTWPIKILFVIYQIKNKVSEGIFQSVVEPQAGFFQSLILNDRSGLSKKWLDRFSQTGLSHIIAISGSHIVIISEILMALAIGFGLARQKAFWFIAGAIIFYIALIGAPASAVRSAIMGIALLFAQKIGRQSQSFNAIIFSAAAMLVVNPKILVFDVGFQLSFLAVIGLIYVAPILKKYFFRLPELWQLKEMTIITLSAQLTTLPLIVFYFHRLSLSSLLANLLTLPIVPFLMVWGIINGIAGVIYLPLGKILGYVSYFSVGYFLWVAKFFSEIPFGSIDLPALSILVVIIMYALIGWWVYKGNQELKLK